MINQESIKELLIINEKIENLKKEMKVLVNTKNILEEKVLKEMVKYEITDKQIETKNYNIDYNIKKTYQSISKTFLENSIEKFCNDNNITDITDKLITHIYNSRDSSEKSYLKIKNKSNS